MNNKVLHTAKELVSGSVMLVLSYTGMSLVPALMIFIILVIIVER